MTTTNDIRAALEAEIANVTGIPSAANRAWENVRFKPTPNTSWVRMTLSPPGRVLLSVDLILNLGTTASFLSMYSFQRQMVLLRRILWQTTLGIVLL